MRLHQSIAHWLETVSGDQAVDIAAELAVHYEQGRDYERAVCYLEHAARKAMRRGATYEAIRHLRAALRVLPTIPQTTGHAERELTLHTLLAPVLLTAKGYGTVEVEQIYAHVRALAQQVEDAPRVFPVLIGVAAFHVVRGEYLSAQEIATQLLQVAQREQDPGLLVEAHALMGVVAFYLGEFITAQAQLEQSMALYDPRQHRAHAMQYGQDPWIACRSYLAWTLWTLGYPDQAQERSREAIAYAQELQHPMSLAFALGLAGILQNAGRDPQAGHDRAEELIALASEHGLPYWVAHGIICRGRALLQSGRATAGLAQIQQAMQARREKDGLGRRPPLALAEAYIATGETQAGFQALAEAHARASSGGERYGEAEVYRLKGELLLTSSNFTGCDA
jgi:adenylate cyclase